MNEANKPEDAPGHYGAGYGEQVPEGAAPRPAPLTDADAPGVPDADPARPPIGVEGLVITETVIVVEPPAASDAASAGEDGAPVTFTPDDVHIRPPDRTPTEEAPESEKAALIFERS